MMILAKQNAVKAAMVTADTQLIVLGNKVEEMNLSDDDDKEASAPAEGKTEALRQLAEERKALDATRKLLDELLAKSQEKAVAKAAGSQSGSTTVTFGDNNSGFQANTINGGVSGLTFGESKQMSVFLLWIMIGIKPCLSHQCSTLNA
jgi:hypothetical protein